ncbi:hypothetical protein V8E51_014864 [Hyaloscypha variabilis]
MQAPTRNSVVERCFAGCFFSTTVNHTSSFSRESVQTRPLTRKRSNLTEPFSPPWAPLGLSVPLSFPGPPKVEKIAYVTLYSLHRLEPNRFLEATNSIMAPRDELPLMWLPSISWLHRLCRPQILSPRAILRELFPGFSACLQESSVAVLPTGSLADARHSIPHSYTLFLRDIPSTLPCTRIGCPRNKVTIVLDLLTGTASGNLTLHAPVHAPVLGIQNLQPS